MYIVTLSSMHFKLSKMVNYAYIQCLLTVYIKYTIGRRLLGIDYWAYTIGHRLLGID